MTNTGSEKETLIHHNFVLTAFNETPIVAKNMTPRLEFNEGFRLSGVMCNRFNGQAELLEGNILKADKLAMTRMLCADSTLNELDNVLSRLLSQGAKMTLEGKTLTLSDSQDTLVFENRDWL